MPRPQMTIESLAEAVRSAYPELDAVRAVAGARVYLVGGAVRDLLLGRGRADIDLVVAGDPTDLAARLGATLLAEHGRFATAKIELDGHVVDIAGARSEAYPQPGALPVVAPTNEIEVDLARRDFTINAMALPLSGPSMPIDPHGGHADLKRGLLRVLHPSSFVDDPTRAIRAARYATRFDFELEPETEALLRATDLGAVSAERRQNELLRLAAEPTGVRGLALLAEWGLLQPREGGLELATRVAELLAAPPWNEAAPHDRVLLVAALGPAGAEVELAAARPRRPSQAVELAAGRDLAELVVARAMGAEWLDRYLVEWRAVALEIGGEDLIAAGVSPGPALGRGLKAALRGKLDGEIAGRDQELAAALAAARGE